MHAPIYSHSHSTHCEDRTPLCIPSQSHLRPPTTLFWGSQRNISNHVKVNMDLYLSYHVMCANGLQLHHIAMRTYYISWHGYSIPHLLHNCGKRIRILECIFNKMSMGKFYKLFYPWFYCRYFNGNVLQNVMISYMIMLKLAPGYFITWCNLRHIQKM